MKENFYNALALVLKSEGGYVNHPNDPGGRTNLGVTQHAWEEYVGHTVSEQDMRNLSTNDVTPFYRKLYWDAARCDELPSGIDYLVFDFAVNAGPHRAIRTLQKALNISADGIIGPITIKAINEADSKALIESFSDSKEDFYRSLNNFSIFGKGWFNRVKESKRSAEGMLV